jgi:hypothetical protein
MANETMTRQEIEAQIVQEQFDALLKTRLREGLVPLVDQFGELAVLVARQAAELAALRARLDALEGRRPAGSWPTA